MNRTITRPPAPAGHRDRTTRRLRLAALALAAAGFIATVIVTAVFIPWSNRYEAIYDQAVETSMAARYPHGFIATGVREGTVLVLMTTTALLAVAVAIAGHRVRTMRARTIAFSIVAAFLAATIVPAAVLYAYFAIVPAMAAYVAAMIALGPARSRTRNK